MKSNKTHKNKLIIFFREAKKQYYINKIKNCKDTGEGGLANI